MAAMILPKGIVFNKDSVYEEIAQYDIVPLDRIIRACNVFSTTSRELFDPTARRLENFWTRVLGGDRRYLSGKLIAKVFKQISEEEPFVKLRGPANRYEPPSPKTLLHHSEGPEPAVNKTIDKAESSKSKSKAKAVPPSSAKVPHPILKKPRGPSASGPRPTARFASPPGSEGEGDGSRDTEGASSNSTNATVCAGPTASGKTTPKEEKRKGSGSTPKKKGAPVVASTASRRRPAMPRRPSSQSSATGGPDVTVKEGNTTAKRGGSQSSVSIISEKPGKGTAPTKETERGEALSEKAAGKRPATRSDAPNRLSDAQERQRQQASPTMHRSQPDTCAPRPSSRDTNRSKGAPTSLLSSSTASISTETARGTIIEFDENIPANEVITSVKREQEDFDPNVGPSGSESRDDRPGLAPSQPNTAPAVPLGRSKSQLSLLLERKGDKKSRR